MIDELMQLIITQLSYLLAVMNIGLILLIYGHRLAVGFNRKRFELKAGRLKPILTAGLQQMAMDDQYIIPLKKNQRAVAFRMLLKMAREQRESLADAFNRLGYTQQVLNNYSVQNQLQTMEALALIKSPLTLNFLYRELAKLSGERAYRAAYALTQVPHTRDELPRLVGALLNARINMDRTSELLNAVGPSPSLLLDFLSISREERVQVIILRCLRDNPAIKGYPLADRLAPITNAGSVEVKVAGVALLGATRTPEAFQLLAEIYKTETSWPVRANIAKVLGGFDAGNAIPILKLMGTDEAWWVRYNALGSLSQLGQGGLDAIIDLSLNSNNPIAFDMAYQVLNSSANVHNTLCGIREARLTSAD